MSDPTPPLAGLRRRLYSMDFLVLFMGLVAVLGLGVRAVLGFTHSTATIPNDLISWAFVCLAAAVFLAGVLVVTRYVWERRHAVGVSLGTRFRWIDDASGALLQETHVEALQPPLLILHARIGAFLLLGMSLVCFSLLSGSVLYAGLFAVQLLALARRSEAGVEKASGGTTAPQAGAPGSLAPSSPDTSRQE